MVKPGLVLNAFLYSLAREKVYDFPKLVIHYHVFIHDVCIHRLQQWRKVWPCR